MRLLADQDVYQIIIERLRESGHDVITAREIGMHDASDEELLNKSKETNRIFLTRDKDFGMLVFLKKKLSTGVILLRVTPSTIDDVFQETEILLKKTLEENLKHLFCVIEPHRYRLRHLR